MRGLGIVMTLMQIDRVRDAISYFRIIVPLRIEHALWLALSDRMKPLGENF